MSVRGSAILVDERLLLGWIQGGERMSDPDELFEQSESLRRQGWIPQEEAFDLLGLPKEEMILWDYIEGAQSASRRLASSTFAQR